MRIKKIQLCNFGSYAGVCEFDLQANKKGNIVLIGGKNGAGKTTLFSGIKLCLYGNKAAGFENINAHYRKEVKKYINDVSRFDISSKCYVKLDMLLPFHEKCTRCYLPKFSAYLYTQIDIHFL